MKCVTERHFSADWADQSWHFDQDCDLKTPLLGWLSWFELKIINKVDEMCDRTSILGWLSPIFGRHFWADWADLSRNRAAHVATAGAEEAGECPRVRAFSVGSRVSFKFLKGHRQSRPIPTLMQGLSSKFGSKTAAEYHMSKHCSSNQYYPGHGGASLVSPSSSTCSSCSSFSPEYFYSPTTPHFLHSKSKNSKSKSTRWIPHCLTLCPSGIFLVYYLVIWK